MCLPSDYELLQWGLPPSPLSFCNPPDQGTKAKSLQGPAGHKDERRAWLRTRNGEECRQLVPFEGFPIKKGEREVRGREGEGVKERERRVRREGRKGRGTERSRGERKEGRKTGKEAGRKEETEALCWPNGTPPSSGGHLWARPPGLDCSSGHWASPRGKLMINRHETPRSQRHRGVAVPQRRTEKLTRGPGTEVRQTQNLRSLLPLPGPLRASISPSLTVQACVRVQ